MLANEIIEHIFNTDKVIPILESLGCHHINSHSPKEYRCGLPNQSSTNMVAVQKTATLKTKIFSPEDIVRGNLFTLIMYIKNCEFIDALKYLHKELGLEYKKYNSKQEEKKENPLDVFLKVKPKRKYKVDVGDIKFIDQEFISDYVPNLYISWLKEGIISKTARRFQIGYDFDSRRIIIPHRYWSGEDDEYIGIMGRSVLTHEQCDLLGIPKYYPIKAHPKGLNLYGLQENYKSIQEKNICLIVESEKSVLKLHSKLIDTAVAICSHHMSDEQVKILIGLDIDELIICYDQDVSLKHVRNECERFYKIRNISYMYDTWGILSPKESPCDKELKIFNFMFKHRVKYDEKEHEKYLKELNEKNVN